MTRWIPSLCLLGLAASLSPPPASAQTPADDPLAGGRIELGTALSFSRFNEPGDDDSATVLSAPLRVGWMLTDRFELEAELLVSYTDFAFDDSETGFIGAGHLLYHFPVSGSSALYVLGGAGYGNGPELLGIIGETDENVAVWRAGAGLKTFFGRRAALRLEYRFTRYQGGEPASPHGYSVRLNDHKVLVGISLWLR